MKGIVRGRLLSPASHTISRVMKFKKYLTLLSTTTLSSKAFQPIINSIPFRESTRTSSTRIRPIMLTHAPHRPGSPSSVTNWDANASGGYATNLRGVFCGSGSDMMYDPRPVQSILEMAGKPLEEVNVVYLGTATYDIEQFQGRQTQRFVEMGCSVTSLKVTTDVPSNMFQLVDEADVIVVGGGNTLFAVDRWRLIGLDTALRTAMERGTIMTGGSAGAICWFDGGHSNSMDPDTYRDFRVRKFGKATQDLDNVVDEIYATSSEEIKDWKYIRISALGFLPGLVSPHHDRVQSNGVLRADDFDRLLLENPGELGIGIDHWAALVVDGMDYHVLSLKDREGSILNGTDFCTDGSGEPGIWIKEVVNGKVVQKVCPSEGRLMDLLRLPSKIMEDIQSVELCRRENRQPELASGPLIVG